MPLDPVGAMQEPFLVDDLHRVMVVGLRDRAMESATPLRTLTDQLLTKIINQYSNLEDRNLSAQAPPLPTCEFLARLDTARPLPWLCRPHMVTYLHINARCHDESSLLYMSDDVDETEVEALRQVKSCTQESKDVAEDAPFGPGSQEMDRVQANMCMPKREDPTRDQRTRRTRRKGSVKYVDASWTKALFDHRPWNTSLLLWY